MVKVAIQVESLYPYDAENCAGPIPKLKLYVSKGPRRLLAEVALVAKALPPKPPRALLAAGG
jgi:hypothetical protein